MTSDSETLKDIESILSMLKPEQIAELMKDIPVNNRAYTIDTSFRERRLAISNLYFKSAIYPHNVGSFEEYKEHDEGIRQQALSGVDL
ncbi:hypothetical protein CMI37_15855 [Candidatus Pacearchaeota archaeon]|nr:hypothetical protein [Candidatus Pacearchaeota archaeon]